jgi:hypothetical protein
MKSMAETLHLHLAFDICGSIVVKALFYKPEGLGFDT